LSNLEKKPSLGNVLSITAVDLETQDHILNYQLPVAISRFNVGLVVIDSITANYRAEHASNSMQALSARSGELAKLGHMLRNLAASEDVAIVVANQVSDRFDSLDGQQQQQQQQQGRVQSTPNRSLPKNRLVEDMPSSSPATQSSQLVEDDAFDGGYLIGHPVRNETLTLAYQEKFFTGWGDDSNSGVSDYFVSEVQKTPALGLVWSTQIACRIVLKKDDETDQARVAAAAAVASSQPVQPVHSGISTARNVSSPLRNLPSKDPQKVENDTKAGTPREPSLSQPAPSTSTPTSTSTTAPAAATSDTKRKLKRRMKLVFAPWASGVVKDPVDDRNNSDEVEFEIWEGGIKSVVRNEEVGNV
jgi:DNA repair protein RAD57